jgi:hypothetical protein
MATGFFYDFFKTKIEKDQEAQLGEGDTNLKMGIIFRNRETLVVYKLRNFVLEVVMRKGTKSDDQRSNFGSDLVGEVFWENFFRPFLTKKQLQ